MEHTYQISKWVIITSILAVTACQQTESTPPSGTPSDLAKATTTQAASTQAMAAELKAIAQDPQNEDMWYLNAKKATKLEAQLPQLTDKPGPWITTIFQASFQWLNAGDYNRSIELLDQLFTYLKTNNINLPPEQITKLKEIQAIAYMRKGEIENCLENHNAYSCLLPIQGPGQHQKKEGSQSAIAIYEKILQSNPNDLQSRWLYNIAHMTLGTYPNAIDPAMRIDPALFKSEATLERFQDIAPGLGLAVNDISGSVVLEDFNNDHYLDILVSSYGLEDQLRYFENDGQGKFVDKTHAAGLTGLWSGLNMVQADYNNDGHIDVLVLRGAWLSKEGLHPNSLLQNNGKGQFTDVTREAGIYSRFPTQTAAWADYNNDGWVDLFIGNESSPTLNAPSELYHNNGDGTFTEKGAALGLNLKVFAKGCGWADVNQDGWQDLYVSNILGDNFLMMNKGQNGGFVDRAGQAGVSNPQFSFPCWFFDYDQDGWEDLFVNGFDIKQFETAAGEVAKDVLGQPTSAEKPQLYRNNGDGTFAEKSVATNVDKVLFTMGCNTGDLNNDGYPDFYAATGTPDFRALIPNKMFLNKAGQRFADVTTAGGFGHLQKGHGVAFGDIDADGDQDVYVVLGGSYQGDNFMNALYQNPGTDAHWITIKLVGNTCNKAAIGARMKTVVELPDGSEKAFYQTVRSGGSFGANTLQLEQGLGTATKIKRLEITWPGQNSPQIVEGVEPNGFYLIEQGKAARVVDRTLIVIQQDAHGEHHHH